MPHNNGSTGAYAPVLLFKAPLPPGHLPFGQGDVPRLRKSTKSEFSG